MQRHSLSHCFSVAITGFQPVGDDTASCGSENLSTFFRPAEKVANLLSSRQKTSLYYVL
jgi:hypothetical protein